MTNNTKETIYTTVHMLRLTKDVKDDTGKVVTQRLVFAFRNGYPRLEVRLSDDYEEGTYWDNTISIPMDSIVMSIIGSIIVDIANDEIDSETVICKNTEFVDGKPTGNIVVTGSINILKVNDRIKMIIKSPKHNPVEFDIIINSKWFTILKDNQDITNEPYMNKKFAIEYGEAIKSLAQAYTSEYAINHLTNVREKTINTNS